jgi:hypothetical protein
MEVELVVFGHGERPYTLVRGIEWHKIIGSRTGRLPLNERVLNIIITLTKAAAALDGIEALKQHAGQSSEGARAQEAKELFDELIGRANALVAVLEVRNDAGKFPGM